MSAHEKGGGLSQGQSPVLSNAGGGFEHHEDSAALAGHQPPPAAPKQRTPYHQDLQGSVSRENAERLGAKGRKILHDAVLAELAKGPTSADEIAQRLGRDHATIRPRLCELADVGLVCHTARRARGVGGGTQMVWRLARPEEIHGLKAARKEARQERDKRKFAKLLVEMGVSI